MSVQEISRYNQARHIASESRNAFGRKQRAAAVAAAAATAESIGSPARIKSINRRLAELERDNYHDNVKIDVPKQDNGRKVGLTVASRRILGSRKTITNHLDDDPPSTRLYVEAASAVSRYPARKYCSVCGFWGDLTCMRCGSKYCSRACEETHNETRCMKSYQ